MEMRLSSTIREPSLPFHKKSNVRIRLSSTIGEPSLPFHINPNVAYHILEFNGYISLFFHYRHPKFAQKLSCISFLYPKIQDEKPQEPRNIHKKTTPQRYCGFVPFLFTFQYLSPRGILVI